MKPQPPVHLSQPSGRDLQVLLAGLPSATAKCAPTQATNASMCQTTTHILRPIQDNSIPWHGMNKHGRMGAAADTLAKSLAGTVNSAATARAARKSFSVWLLQESVQAAV